MIRFGGKNINRTAVAQKTAAHPGCDGVLTHLQQSSRDGHHLGVKARKSTFCNFNATH